MSFEQINLDPNELLAAANENLNARFYASSRLESKQLYQQLVDGQSVPFMHIGTQDSGEVVTDLVLDHSEYVGAISFSRFRKGLAMLMLSIKHRLDKNLSMNPLFSETGEVLFNVPGVHEAEDGTNVLVAGLQQVGPGHAALKLMYLNPTEYIKAAAEVSDPPSSSNA